jgi:hypothetical protein
MNITKVTINDSGTVSVRTIQLVELTIEACLRHVGHTKLCKMDKVRVEDNSIVVEIAQDKPWTYFTYVFVQSP